MCWRGLVDVGMPMAPTGTPTHNMRSVGRSKAPIATKRHQTYHQHSPVEHWNANAAAEHANV